MTDGSMITLRQDDVLKTEGEDEKDLVPVSEGGQCAKCFLFFSIMILLPALVFMFIHLGNNDWKFKIEQQPEPKKTFEDIVIPSISNCGGEFLFSEKIDDIFGTDFK